MKVKDLIEKLMTVDPDLDAVFNDGSSEFYIERVINVDETRAARLSPNATVRCKWVELS